MPLLTSPASAMTVMPASETYQARTRYILCVTLFCILCLLFRLAHALLVFLVSLLGSLGVLLQGQHTVLCPVGSSAGGWSYGGAILSINSLCRGAMAARDVGQGNKRTPYLFYHLAELHVHLLGAHASVRTDHDGVQKTPYDTSECALGFVVWGRVEPGKASWWGGSIFPCQRTCTRHCPWRNLDPSCVYRL
jgi:hypothetical protein